MERSAKAALEVRSAVEEAAQRAGALAALRLIIKELKISSPGIANRIGW